MTLGILNNEEVQCIMGILGIAKLFCSLLSSLQSNDISEKTSNLHHWIINQTRLQKMLGRKRVLLNSPATKDNYYLPVYKLGSRSNWWEDKQLEVMEAAFQLLRWGGVHEQEGVRIISNWAMQGGKEVVWGGQYLSHILQNAISLICLISLSPVLNLIPVNLSLLLDLIYIF